jgi:hypothetical protein
MDRQRWRRLLWVVSLVAILGGSLFILARYGAEWGIGAAP